MLFVEATGVEPQEAEEISRASVAVGAQEVFRGGRRALWTDIGGGAKSRPMRRPTCFWRRRLVKKMRLKTHSSNPYTAPPERRIS